MHNHPEKAAVPKVSVSVSQAIANSPQKICSHEEVQVGQMVVPAVESSVLQRSPRTSVEKRNTSDVCFCSRVDLSELDAEISVKALSAPVPTEQSFPEKVTNPKMASPFSQSTMKPPQPPEGAQAVLECPILQRSSRDADECNKLLEVCFVLTRNILSLIYL
jgi:hypothetical protein